MTAMSTVRALPRAARASNPALAPAALFAALLVALALGGCATTHPQPLSVSELAEAQTFPFFRVYWTGPSFEGHPVTAADGLRNYDPAVGDSVYYGDCVQSKGIFGGGSCLLPLHVSTVVYVLHSNAPLGPQRNILVRGVPATVYDEGRSIELYTGRLAVDIFSDDPERALRAARELRPLNAPGSASGELPAPVFCPGLSGPLGPSLARVMASLRGHVCEHAAAEKAYAKEISR